MKPTDKAIDAGYEASANSAKGSVFGRVSRSTMKEILTAAYAAQFQSEDYAGLINWLRDKNRYCSTDGPVAADAIEALLAKLNNKLKPSEDYADLIRSLRGEPPTNSTLDPLRAADALEAVMAERDALKSELIDYKDAATFVNELGEKIQELNVEIDKWESAYKEITDTRVKIEETTVDKLKKVETERDALAARLAHVDDEALVEMAAVAINDSSKNITRAAIAAIRPHIEAAERERCAKALEITSDEIRLHAGEMTAQEMRNVLAVLTWRAAAIRWSGK